MDAVVPEEALAALRAAGARFVLLFGSRARGDARPNSDLDLAAWFV
ncbi:MAG: nucleotidyltransferase domain-containing protein [Candidatus Nanopelagicales bacterium]